MMEKLMIDTGVTWVRDYKVTGFRFDIMGFHPLDSMKKFQDAVKAVDSTVYVYGEGWNFGTVQDDARFVTARQANLGGTGSAASATASATRSAAAGRSTAARTTCRTRASSTAGSTRRTRSTPAVRPSARR